MTSSAEVVHELSSCLARTAEQQQLLHDAARLLTHGKVTPLTCFQACPETSLKILAARGPTCFPCPGQQK